VNQRHLGTPAWRRIARALATTLEELLRIGKTNPESHTTFLDAFRWTARSYHELNDLLT